MANSKKILSTVGSTAGLLIILGIVIAANAIIGNFRGLRGDFTSEKLYTLSDGTKNLLKENDREVTLKLFYSKDTPGLPMPLKQYAQRIIDLLKEYETHSGKKVIVEVLNPSPDSDEEEWARKYGLAAQAINPLGGDEIYLGLVASSGKNEAAIPFIAPQVEPELEYMVTKLVNEVTLDERPKLGLVSSLPVMGGPQLPPQMSQGRPPAPAWYFTEALAAQWEIEDLGPTFTEVASDIQTLLVIHPKDLSDDALYALDQFVLRGGRLFAFLDPMSIAEQQTTPQQNQFGFLNASSDLNKLTEKWGITLNAGQVVGDFKAATRLQQGESVTFLSLRGDNVNKNEISTSSLDSIMMPFAGNFIGTPAEGLTKTVLISSSEEAGVVNSFQAMGNPDDIRRELKPSGKQELAVRLTGKFKTAFPEKEGGLKEAEKNGVVVLVSDADMLFDQFCVRIMNFLGNRMAQPVNNNLAFVENVVEQLNGSDALIGLRSRGTFDRSFDRVRDMQAVAQKKYQAEAQKLHEELQDAQKRINELQASKSDDQKFIISKEQQDELKKVREKEFETSKKLKEVRKELRKEVDDLGTKLKFWNIAGIPMLVALFGIVRGVRRKSASSGR